MRSLSNDEKGNIVLIIIAGILAILIIPPIILAVFPPAKILFQILAIFIIYSIVRGYLGGGPLTLIISAVLIYFLVFKYTYLFASAYIFQTLLGVQFMSVTIWSLGTLFKPKH